MPRKTEDLDLFLSPSHFDVRRDTIISTPKGKEVGIASDFKQIKNILGNNIAWYQMKYPPVSQADIFIH